MKNLFLLLAAVLLIQQVSAQCGTSVTQTNVTCNGSCDGSITLTPSSGTPPYSLSINGTPVTTFPVSYTVTGLCANSYTWLITDAISSCSDNGNVAITEPSVLVPSLDLVTNVTCNGANDGSGCISATGGTSPYTYSWSDGGGTNACHTGLQPITYTVTITDFNNCTATISVPITEPTLLVASIASTTDVTCNGGSDGSVTMNASGGIPPYQFSIDGGITWQTSSVFNNLTAGNYTGMIMDLNGCGTTQGFSILEPSVLQVSITGPTNVLCYGDTATICANVTGGITPYVYIWSNGATTSCISGLVAGTYTFTVIDVGGCTVTDSITIAQPPPITININSIPPSCGQCDGYATAVVSGGSPMYTYLWTPGGTTTPVLSNLCSGNYHLAVVDVNGCLDTTGISFPLQCDSVWPGDANLDGVADNNDVLSLGISFGSTGPVRAGATNTWTGQTCLNWNNELLSGTNYKHSDCDGNGIVNADDTLPISLNYGLTHLRPNPPSYNAALPDLYLEATVDTAGLNQLLHVKIHLGTSVTPVPAVYGLAFTLTFDQTLVDTTTASFDYSMSALGTIGSDLLSFQHSFYSAGAIDVAITRTNQTDVLNVDSVIGIFEVVITDNVSAIDQLRFDISNVTTITHNQSLVALNAIGDSVTVDPSYVGIPVINLENEIHFFPSPVKDQLKINSLVEVERIELVNELGETIFGRSVHQKNFSLDMNGIKNGMYFLQLTTSQGLVRKKVCVMK